MLKNFTLLTLSCFCLFLISCEKDIENAANPGGTARYSLAGAPSGCTAPVVAGIYSVGTALTPANTITLSVDVALKGTYSINTTSANGVRFSGSGLFANTGIQTVVLTGTGTPVRAGNFAFVPNTNNTCNFSISFGAGGASAVYTYAGAPGNCTAPNISGSYTTGTALGSNNYVDLAVNVTTPGAYTIITNNLNGISFSGNGVFTAAGAQVVRLIGNGTPSATGSFTYTPSNNGCGFSITVNAPAPPATYTYDGAPGSCLTPVINGTYAAGTALNATNTIVLKVTVSVIGSYNVSTNSSNGVVFSGSGNFTTIGANTITLSSTSTPAAAGPFTYTPTNNGCSFDITYTAGPPPPSEFLTCKINGVTTNFNLNLVGILDQSAAPYSFAVTGENSGGGPDNLSISLTDNGSPIANGNYSNITATNTNKGCFITYSPTFGSMNPFFSSPINNNSFTVTITGITATRVNGTFSGTIFDNFGMGSVSKNITAGSFSVSY